MNKATLPADAYKYAKYIAGHRDALPMLRHVCRELVQEIDWLRIQVTLGAAHSEVAMDDAEHRLDVIAERHSDRVPDVLDPAREMCAVCLSAWPCPDFRDARGMQP